MPLEDADAGAYVQSLRLWFCNGGVRIFVTTAAE